MSFAPFIGPIISIVERLIPDPAEQQQLVNQLEMAAQEAETKFAQAQSEVVKAEAQGNALQRNWRPVLMYLLMGVIVWHMIAVPILATAFGVPALQMVGLALLPEGVWTLLTVGMGGYIGARTWEKVKGVVR